MQNLRPNYFFDLSRYRHASLFDNVEFVWQVLTKISSYIKQQPLGKIEATVPPGAYIINPGEISIGEGTTIEPGAYIKGPCIIGKNCTIRHGAYIRGDVITGDKCVIGHDTEIKNSVMLDDSHAAHFAYVGDSILGNNVNLGAGTKCANLKLDNGLITIVVEGQRIETGLRKFGAIIGDGCQIGCNSVTNPGTLFGKLVLCYPCINVGGFIPSRNLIHPESKALISSIK